MAALGDDVTNPTGGNNRATTHIRWEEAGGFRVTETKHASGSKIPMHAHTTASMYLLLQGNVTERFGRQVEQRCAGDLTFTPANELHANDFDGPTGSCFYLELDPAAVTWAQNYGCIPGVPMELCGHAVQLMERLHAEYQMQDSMFPLILESTGLELIAHLSRQSSSGKERRQVPRWLLQTKDYLDSAYTQRFSLSEIARVIGSHPVYLARAFRRYFGCSVGEYIRTKRVQFACAELSRGIHDLVEIATLSGFSDKSHFSNTFRAVVGMTPGRYRQVCAKR